MKMNQNERRFDFHGLGAALKRAREEKGWTQAYVAELVDRDSRTIMNIENRLYLITAALFGNRILRLAT
jgi:transcriptional regulator with XRE-family HTH domain